jgi:RNA polymerase sigma factor (sigma-70 family)
MQGMHQEKRDDMSARAVLDSGTEPVVQVFDGTLPPPRRAVPPATSDAGAPEARVGVRRTSAESRVADLAAERFRAYRAGDGQALEAMVESLTPLLWHIVRAYGLDTATAEDVVQNTWLTLVRKADSVAEPQAVLRWLTVTARRDAWRAARTTNRMDLTDDMSVLDVREAGESPEQDVLRAADQRALWDAVAKLNERCQRLLRIIAFHDRPDYAALSKELGMPLGSIGPTRGRCLDKVRSELAAMRPGARTDWSPA